jgi:para-aminobenzoate synthetase component 1
LIAQPIKGTIRRGKNEAEDEILRLQLLHSEKERAENLMIVDLMRNDLSRISEVGSVEVEELFGVYPFPKVHQMISTVRSSVKQSASLAEIFQATFPMGSMTGAPKIKCMELIELYENFKRGWFSGTLGVVQPNGDFDFNVIIRSIVFDKSLGMGYFAVGSAITYDADPAYEYEECLLKASAILEVLTRQR